MFHSDRKIVQDRAIRSISARAATRQIFERLAHRSELVLLALHLRGSCKREGLDLTTRPIAVLPQRDELAETPVIKSILETFPGAEIESVRPAGQQDEEPSQ